MYVILTVVTLGILTISVKIISNPNLRYIAWWIGCLIFTYPIGFAAGHGGWGIVPLSLNILFLDKLEFFWSYIHTIWFIILICSFIKSVNNKYFSELNSE
jgi:hypothetical protein